MEDTPDNLPVSPPSALAQDQFSQDQQGTPPTATIPPFKFPEHHPFPLFAGYLSHLNAREDQRALAEYQVNLGLAEFQQRQREIEQANQQKYAALAEIRATKDQEVIDKGMDYLADMNAKILTGESDLGKQSAGIDLAGPQALAAFNARKAEIDHQKQTRDWYEGYLHAHMQDKQKGLGMAMDHAYAALSSPPSKTGEKAGTPVSSAEGETADLSAESGGQAAQAPMQGVSTPEDALTVLSGKYGFPQGRIENGAIHFIAGSKDEKALLDERLKAFRGMGMTVPAYVEDMGATADANIKLSQQLSSDNRNLTGKISFYQAMKRTSDKDAMIRAVLQDQTNPMATEEGPNLGIILGANEKERQGIINDIISSLEAQQRPIEQRIKDLAPWWDYKVKQSNEDLARVGIAPSKSGGQPRLDKPAFFQKYAADHGLTLPLDPAKHQKEAAEMLKAWNDYNK